MRKQIQIAAIMSLTLGLAPYYPHAHIWKQLKNLWYQRPMANMDWVDLVMHGTPWVVLIFLLIKLALKKRKEKKAS